MNKPPLVEIPGCYGIGKDPKTGKFVAPAFCKLCPLELPCARIKKERRLDERLTRLLQGKVRR